MSHFTVLVRVPDNDETMVEALLKPYDENKSEEFEDEEDEHLEKYKTEGSEMVRTKEGALVLPWDERFRAPGAFGIGSGTHKVPDDLERVQVPYTTRYSTFEIFMKDWCGFEERDPQHGRYGRWHNSNARWDWWTVGGRWNNKLRVRNSEGGQNAARISSLDMAWAQAEAERKVGELWAEIDGLLSGRKFDDFYGGPRGDLLDLGIMDCLDEGEFDAAKVFYKKPWERSTGNGKQRYDVIERMPSPDELREQLLARENPFHTFAALDADGWREPGKMGWWACTSSTSEGCRKFDLEFFPRLAAGRQDDWVFVVDCHI